MEFMMIEGEEIPAEVIKIPETMAQNIDVIIEKYQGQFESREDFVRYALIKVLTDFKSDL